MSIWMALLSLLLVGCEMTSPKAPLAGQARLPALERAAIDPYPREVLPEGWVTTSGDPAMGDELGDSFDRLVAALEEAGFDKWAVYAYADGYAVVTRIEQIEPSGAPTAKRFSVRTPWARPTGFSPKEQRDLLFPMTPGRYRYFVFTVASKAGQGPRSAEVPIDGDDVGEGALPDELRGVTAKDRSCEVTVVELERGADTQQPAVDAEGGATVREHLERAGLWRGRPR